MSAELQFERLYATLKDGLVGVLKERAIADSSVVMVGIQTGGMAVSERLHKELRIRTPLASLNINFYRDDFSRTGLQPKVGPSELHTTIENRHVILVDDVLHTGRTVRAALNELFDYGRPASVILAVLVARDGRELPVQPDACGLGLRLEAGANIKLNADTLDIQIVDGS